MVLLQCVVLSFLVSGVVPLWHQVGKTRTVRLKQGDVVGLVFESDLSELGPVEVYRGVPYATAQRFMPPSSPARFDWMEATNNGPVCPQNLIDLDPSMGPRGGSGRLGYLRRLLPFLKDQSENCLNLNIYVPSQAYLNGLGGNLNVIVFIHGESFSWNSGNPYDGSTLASYGNIIFVTLNYRLGILGFLNSKNKTTSNFGLLDQIAALRWLKDNIAAFGGDPNAITLMGHHTGAIAVNYLMLSPVSRADNGLFQRAILMSGTALSSWAQTKHAEDTAESIARQTNCPMSDLLSCLKNKRLHEILAVKDLPEDPAPSVDGIVVKVQPKDLMSHNNDLFTRYDLLCGVTESESYHVLDSFALRQGLFYEDIKELLTKFFKGNFQNWEMSQDRAMRVYGLDKQHSMNPMDGRDKTLQLLSDARVVAPMVQTAVYHSTPGEEDIQTFLYVFSHKSKHGDHPLASVSVQGEDLAYVLGAPIEGGLHAFPEDYSQEEKHLAETMMSLWVNFAKTGNPNIPKRRNYLIKGQSDWTLEDVDWPAFEPNNQHYYQIQIPPRIGTKYKDNLMHFWNYYLPTMKPLQVPLAPNQYTSTKTDPGFDEVQRKPDWSFFPPPWRPTRKPIYGYIVTPKPYPRPPPMDESSTTDEPEDKTQESSASSFTFTVLIVVGVCFLIINIVSFVYIWYQKKKLKKERMMARYRRGSSPSITDMDFHKKEEKCEIKSILKSNERLYDPIKLKGSQFGKWTGLYSHGSSSTVTIDPHTKVSQWMKSEKASIGSKSKTDKSSDTIASAATTSRASRFFQKKPEVKKVSVAVDATPNARSASVLKQTPIELTKSLDFGKKRLGETHFTPLQRSASISEDDKIPNHSHSNSDPVEFFTTDLTKKEDRVLKTFEPLLKDRGGEDGSLSAEEALDNFKRRNYPKVLPDFPTSPSLSGSDYGRTKRLSLPVPTPLIDARKVPPPPPPRIATATVSRHPRNRTTVPNFMNSYSEIHAISDMEGQKSDKEDKKPKKAKEEKNKDKKIEKRPEPRVIIKPTLTDPNLKKINSKIPRVTHQPDTPKVQKKTSKESKSLTKAKPVLKKSVGTEASGNTSGTSGSSSVSSIATVRKAQKE